MTILLSSSTNALFITRAIIPRGISSAAFSITIWGGAQPTAANLITNWTSYFNTNLIHYDYRATYCPQQSSAPAYGSYFGPATLANNGVWIGASASNTGNATWGVVWAGGSQVNSLTSTIPTTSFIIVPVSDLAGNGVIKFSSISMTAGQSYQISSFNLTISN